MDSYKDTKNDYNITYFIGVGMANSIHSHANNCGYIIYNCCSMHACTNHASLQAWLLMLPLVHAWYCKKIKNIFIYYIHSLFATAIPINYIFLISMICLWSIASSPYRKYYLLSMQKRDHLRLELQLVG